MLEAILKEVKVSSSTWQALLLAGLLPAVVVDGGWMAWQDGGVLLTLGLKGISDFVTHFKDTKDFLVHESVPVAGMVLIALLFYILRPIIQYLLKRPPLISIPLRWYQRWNKQQKLRKLSLVLWEHDALEWHKHTFAIPDHSDEVLPTKCPKSLSRSEAGRKILSSTPKANPNDIEKWWDGSGIKHWLDRRKIKAALFQLFKVVSYAKLVEIRAYFNSLDSLNASLSSDQIWEKSEEQLNVHVPKVWRDELKAWVELGSGSNFAAKALLVRIESESVSLIQYSRARRVLDRAPADPWLEPTALGNLLAALEEYGQARYTIDTSSLWSRVEQIATKEQRATVAAAKLSLETACNLTAAFVLLACVPLFFRAQPPNLYVSVFFCAAAAGLAWVFYIATLAAAEALSERMKAVIDINVLSLLRAVGLQPSTGAQRKEMLDALSDFLVNGKALPDAMPTAGPPSK